MEINGLPAHPLLVHLVVVLLPLSAQGAVLVSAWPAAQRRIGVLVPLGAVVGAAAVPVTTKAGRDLAQHFGNPPFIQQHQAYGNQVLPWAAALAVVTVVQWFVLRRPDVSRGLRALLGAAVVVSAVGTVAIVVLTGDSGARAVWGSR
jgi:hypothetical protein